MRALALLAALVAGLVALPDTAPAQGAADIFAGFRSDSDNPVEVEAETLEIFEEGDQRVARFTGGVEVRRGETLIRAAQITLYADVDAASPDAFNRIEADGDILVRSGDQTVTGEAAVVDMTSNTITVSGGVVLAQGTNVISGSRLVVNIATGKARVEQAPGGRIRGVFAPGGS